MSRRTACIKPAVASHAGQDKIAAFPAKLGGSILGARRVPALVVGKPVHVHRFRTQRHHKRRLADAGMVEGILRDDSRIHERMDLDPVEGIAPVACSA